MTGPYAVRSTDLQEEAFQATAVHAEHSLLTPLITGTAAPLPAAFLRSQPPLVIV